MNAQHPALHACRRRRRNGLTITEFIVACSLLSSMLVCIVPAVARNGRVQQTLRHDRIGMDELSNQVDRLTRLPLEQLRIELANLQPSQFAETNLPDPQLSGTLDASMDGQRLSLRLAWDSLGRDTAPLKITTWVYPPRQPNSETP